MVEGKKTLAGKMTLHSTTSQQSTYDLGARDSYNSRIPQRNFTYPTAICSLSLVSCIVEVGHTKGHTLPSENSGYSGCVPSSQKKKRQVKNVAARSRRILPDT